MLSVGIEMEFLAMLVGIDVKAVCRDLSHVVRWN